MLFPSTLVISSDLGKIDSLLVELGHLAVTNDPDIFLVSEYTVENIRQINKFLSRQPYSHHNKIVIIPEAHLLNLESQNTLLKNLEEPGENNYFILVTPKPNSLLETIVSRCRTIRFLSPAPDSVKFTLPGSIKESLILSESLAKDKDTVLPLLENLIASTPRANFSLIKKLIKAGQMIRANLDPKTVLDFLFLSLLV